MTNKKEVPFLQSFKLYVDKLCNTVMSYFGEDAVVSFSLTEVRITLYRLEYTKLQAFLSEMGETNAIIRISNEYAQTFDIIIDL